MKKINKYLLPLGAVSIALAVALASCTSFTKGYSNNPLAPQGAGAPQLFLGAQGAFDEFMEGFPSLISTEWSQQITGASAQFGAYQLYTTTAGDYQNDWATAYANVLYDLKLSEQEAAKSGQYSLLGADYALEGMQMGTITALWGAVPYSEAAQPDKYTTPKFDPQLQVYTEAQAVLDSAVALLTKYNSPITGDIFSSGGSTAEWLAAAYTEKARLMMEVARHDNYSTTDLNNVINWAKNGILAVDGSQDMMFLHTGGVHNGDMNLWNSFGTIDRPGDIGAASTFLAPMLEAYGLGNELTFYYDTASGDLNYGAGFSATAPFPVFRASEGNLLIAEAYARMNQLGNALPYLNAAIEYNNNAFGDSLATYVTGDSAVASQSVMLQTIFNEEYMSLFPEVESFTFLRRIDYDIRYQNSSGATVVLSPTTGTQFPQRFFYPTNEITANPNTPAQTKPDLFKATTVNSVADPMLPK